MDAARLCDEIPISADHRPCNSLSLFLGSSTVWACGLSNAGIVKSRRSSSRIIHARNKRKNLNYANFWLSDMQGGARAVMQGRT